jgi:hypothetical protein
MSRGYPRLGTLKLRDCQFVSYMLNKYVFSVVGR